VAEINLKEQINKLIELQAVDSQIYSLQAEKDAQPGELQKLDLLFEEKKQHLAELEKKLLDLHKQRKDKELELASKEEAIKKTQTQLYQLKTNKEYSAMLKEIDGIKADASVLEDQIIQVLEQLDAAKAEIEKERQLLQQEEKRNSEAKNKVQVRIKEIDEKLNQLHAQRERVLPEVGPKILSQYERVLKNREWLAIVQVKDNACQGCFMNVPPQVINLIKMYERIVTCGVCQRILYIDENEPA
jgi:hypothetical protein